MQTVNKIGSHDQPRSSDPQITSQDSDTSLVRGRVPARQVNLLPPSSEADLAYTAECKRKLMAALREADPDGLAAWLAGRVSP